MKNKFYDYASLDGDRLKNHNENLHKNSAVIPNIDLANGSSSYILHFFNCMGQHRCTVHKSNKCQEAHCTMRILGHVLLCMYYVHWA